MQFCGKKGQTVNLRFLSNPLKNTSKNHIVENEKNTEFSLNAPNSSNIDIIIDYQSSIDLANVSKKFSSKHCWG